MNLIQYQAECQNTKSTEFFGDRVTKLFFKNSILEAVEALTRLDAIKKSLFYSKASTRYPVNGGFEDDRSGATVETCADVVVVILDEYGKQFHNQVSIDLIHGIIGKATEAAELLQALYIAAYNDQPLDAINIIEEVGDGFWYDAIILQAFNVEFHEAAEINNAKLKKRFQNKFTTDAAITRDLTAERETLEIPAFLRKPEGESDGDMLQRLGTDGHLWATEFVGRLNKTQLPLDVDTMRAWFANAIEAGRSVGATEGNEHHVNEFFKWVIDAACDKHKPPAEAILRSYEQFRNRYTSEAISDRVKEENAG